MKRLVVVPDGWPCKLSECPSGLFMFEGALVVKSKYGPQENALLALDGGIFTGQTEKEKRGDLIVQPCRYEWIEE